jgi:flavin-dependent dehydrogenase
LKNILETFSLNSLKNDFLKNVIIIGGGLAGLISGIQLAKSGIQCIIIEKKSYPLHRVCGEYISNEAEKFLRDSSLYPDEFLPPQINTFQLSSVTGKNAIMPLDMGGFGISRYVFDNFLYLKAKKLGVEFYLNTEVEDVQFDQQQFIVTTRDKIFHTDLVIGSFGKRSRVDVQLKRNFVLKRSPYVGIKYHAYTDHSHQCVALHNFDGGYCGISNIEDGKSNICYLTHRSNLKRYKDIKEMEENILFKNPLLKSIFKNSDFIFKKPEVINEISFATKSPVENHVLMAGDAAGMITPLCGNGMAMAIHSAKLLCEEVISHARNLTSREQMENSYAQKWNTTFSDRLWRGRQIQKLFGNPVTSSLAVNLILFSKPVARLIIRNTHGKVF